MVDLWNRAKIMRHTVLLVALLAIFFACEKQSHEILVAKVDNKNIFDTAIVESFKKLIPQPDARNFNRVAALELLQHIIEKKIILNDAAAHGFIDDVRIKKSLAKIRNLVYYLAARQQFLLRNKTKTKAQQEAVLRVESQKLLQKYGFVLNEEEIEKSFPEIKKQNGPVDELLTSRVLAEFNGGKVFLSDLRIADETTNSIKEFRRHVFAIARKKVFAVWAVKNKLHEKRSIIAQVEDEQKNFILEKYELVQFNRFLKSINRKRLNISNSSLSSFTKKMNPRQIERWNNYRSSWIENIKKRHKIMLSEKGLQIAIAKIQRLRAK